MTFTPRDMWLAFFLGAFTDALIFSIHLRRKMASIRHAFKIKEP